MPTHTPTHELNDGATLPMLGFGTAPLNDEESRAAVRSSLSVGYRIIDTGAIYGNERGVGLGISDSDVPRNDVVVVTKVRGRDQGFDRTLRAFDESAARLGTERVELYLIHWPNPEQDLYLETWRAMIRLRDEGRVRSIGVSNFTEQHLRRLIAESGVTPAVNQIELHPGLDQRCLREFNTRSGIRTMGYSPLGRGSGFLDGTAVSEIAHVRGLSAAQVALRWQIQLGSVPLPRTANPDHQESNFDVFDFHLDEEEMRRITTETSGERIGFDPATHIEL